MEVKFLIAEQIKYSQRLNPYVAKDAVLLSSYAIYKYKLQKGDSNAIGRKGISSRRRPRDIAMTQMPRAFQTSLSNKLNEKDVPVWDITFAQLNKAYNKARFDNYLTTHDPIETNRCLNRIFKRRIPWLFPDGGKLCNPEYLITYIII